MNRNIIRKKQVVRRQKLDIRSQTLESRHQTLEVRNQKLEPITGYNLQSRTRNAFYFPPTWSNTRAKLRFSAQQTKDKQRIIAREFFGINTNINCMILYMFIEEISNMKKQTLALWLENNEILHLHAPLLQRESSNYKNKL